jgi:hypothetical protein
MEMDVRAGSGEERAQCRGYKVVYGSIKATTTTTTTTTTITIIETGVASEMGIGTTAPTHDERETRI